MAACVDDATVNQQIKITVRRRPSKRLGILNTQL